MRLLVTGGSGFIGSNFIRHMLASREDVSIVNLDKLTYAGNPQNLADMAARHGGARYHFIKGDICDACLLDDILHGKAVDAVINFAAETHVDRSIADSAPFLTTNVMGTHALLEAARKARVERFVHISTDEVYGALGPTGTFTETTPLAPNSPYSASKAGADMLCRAYFKTHGMPVVITRCSNNYGPYQFPEKLIPLMILKARAGEALPVYGDGLHVRDWIHVLDHCRGVELALMKGEPGEVYNFGSDNEKANLEVVRTILAILGKSEDLIRFVADRPGHDRRYAMGYEKAQARLGFTPLIGFADGLRETVRWYEDNAAWLSAVQTGAYREFMDSWYGERK